MHRTTDRRPVVVETIPALRRAPRSAGAVALTLLLAAAAVALVSCAATPPSEPAGITGTVTSLVPGDERPDSILVEAPAAPTSSSANKAQVTITPQTLFFGADRKPAKASGIVVGTKVAVWFEGPVAESYPVQGRAKAVQILGK